MSFATLGPTALPTTPAPIPKPLNSAPPAAAIASPSGVVKLS